MYADLNALVAILAAVLAVSIACHIVVLRRISQLSAAQRDHDVRDIVALRAAIVQMLEDVSQLSSAVDRKLGQLPQSTQPAQSQQGMQPQQKAQSPLVARAMTDAGVYGPGGLQKETVAAAPAAPAPTRAPASPPTLESLLEASDRVVDKLELARQAGVGVGEVELWLRRRGQKATPASQTRTPAGV